MGRAKSRWGVGGAEQWGVGAQLQGARAPQSRPHGCGPRATQPLYLPLADGPQGRGRRGAGQRSSHCGRQCSLRWGLDAEEGSCQERGAGLRRRGQVWALGLLGRARALLWRARELLPGLGEGSQGAREMDAGARGQGVEAQGMWLLLGLTACPRQRCPDCVPQSSHSQWDDSAGGTARGTRVALPAQGTGGGTPQGPHGRLAGLWPAGRAQGSLGSHEDTGGIGAAALCASSGGGWTDWAHRSSLPGA